MMTILLKKISGLFFLLISLLTFAQSVPPPPENPESGDIGAYPASPIDAYTVVLFIIAIILIVHFTIKHKQRILQ